MISNISKSEEYNNGKYKFIKLSNGESNFNRIVCESDSICIIPFDTSNGKIKNVYLSKYTDYMSGDESYTCINDDIQNDSSSTFEDINSIISKNLGISAEVDELYYLGSIKHNIPFSKTYECYALNLDSHSDNLNGFKPKLGEHEMSEKLDSLSKIKFNRILSGDISDSLCLSASMLLISYLD